MVSVRYHATEVVRVDRGTGLVVLNSGGWRTPTTKTRMNQASRQFDLGYLVSQIQGEWRVQLPDGVSIPFEDGMTLVVPSLVQDL
jgi:hypothetical protein